MVGTTYNFRNLQCHVSPQAQKGFIRIGDVPVQNELTAAFEAIFRGQIRNEDPTDIVKSWSGKGSIVLVACPNPPYFCGYRWDYSGFGFIATVKHRRMLYVLEEIFTKDPIKFTQVA